MKTRRFVVLVAMMLLLSPVLAACSPSGKEMPDKVTIAMGFIPNVQFAPMYVALEKGYFEDEGLNVELDYGMETDLFQLLGTNQIHFAIGSGDQAVLARANELPVVSIVNWYRRFPVSVVSLADKGIAQSADLVGKTVGTPVTQGASYIGWLAFAEESGLSTDDVNLQVIGYTQFASLTEGRVDAAICYAMNEPVQLRSAGYDVNEFMLDEYTALVSNCIFTNNETIEKQPKLVEAVTRAFIKGLEDTLANPDETFEIVRRAIPDMDDASAPLQRAVLDACLDYWGGENLGLNSPQAWTESVELLTHLGLLNKSVAPESLYDNQFVD